MRFEHFYFCECRGDDFHGLPEISFQIHEDLYSFEPREYTFYPIVDKYSRSTTCQLALQASHFGDYAGFGIFFIRKYGLYIDYGKISDNEDRNLISVGFIGGDIIDVQYTILTKSISTAVLMILLITIVLFLARMRYKRLSGEQENQYSTITSDQYNKMSQSLKKIDLIANMKSYAEKTPKSLQKDFLKKPYDISVIDEREEDSGSGSDDEKDEEEMKTIDYQRLH